MQPRHSAPPANANTADAATLSKKDRLDGFKENVIMGHLIPSGTGLPAYRRLRLSTLGGAPAEHEDVPAVPAE